MNHAGSASLLSRLARRNRRLMLVGLAIAANWICAGADAQEPQPIRDAFMGYAQCMPCHSAGLMSEAVSGTELCRWQLDDPHSKAFQSLATPLAEQMSQRLGFDVKTRRECLNCHAGTHNRGLTDQDLTNAKRFERGVECESCHGTARENKTTNNVWLNEHRLLGADNDDHPWRRLTPGDKEKRGMIDVRQPARKAAICAGCHVGQLATNSADDRFVTHVMYEAGHPPLPNFELVTFQQELPPHWLPHPARGARAQKELNAAYGYDLGVLRDTVETIHGSLAAWQASLSIFVELAKRQPASDLAIFECSACHHELRSPTVRRVPRPGRPGRPTLTAWPGVSAKNLLEALAASDNAWQPLKEKLGELSNHEQTLLRGVRERPHSPTPQTIDAATKLHGTLGELVGLLDSRRTDFSASTAQNLAQRMVKMAPGDFSSTRQNAWLVQRIGADAPAAVDAQTLQQLREMGRKLRPQLQVAPDGAPEPECKVLPASALQERWEKYHSDYRTALDALYQAAIEFAIREDERILNGQTEPQSE